VLAPEDLLSKSQRNDLFSAVWHGAPVAEFDLKVGYLRSGKAAKNDTACVYIDHQASKSQFVITPRPNYRFSISGQLDDGEKIATDLQRSLRFLTTLKISTTLKLGWKEVPPLAAEWARKIIEIGEEYANTHDMWANLRHSKRILTGSYENTPLTASEQTEVSSQIQRVKEFIKETYELTAGQIAEVEERLDQAEQASRRMGRKDWLMLFNGAVFSLILSDLVPQQAAQHILLMTLHGLGHLFGIGAPPLHLPHGG
jgi:hypothetical protein